MRLPQFTIAGILLAMFWLGVCFVGWRLPDHLNMPGLTGTLIVAALRYITIPTAIGALFGYTSRGFLIGVVLFIGLLAWSFFALLLWSGT